MRDPFDRISVPEAEYDAMLEPCAAIVKNYKHVLEDHGVNMDEVLYIAQSFDLLRQARRQSSQMIEHNSDRAMYQYFTTRFKRVISKIKEMKNQEIPAVINIQATEMLQCALNEKLSEYFGFVDPDVKQVFTCMHEIQHRTFKNCMDLYHKEVAKNPLGDEILSLRASHKSLEKKYHDEIEASSHKHLQLHQLEEQLANMQSEVQEANMKIQSL